MSAFDAIMDEINKEFDEVRELVRQAHDLLGQAAAASKKGDHAEFEKLNKEAGAKLDRAATIMHQTDGKFIAIHAVEDDDE
jgi:hypothetical protein